MIDRATLPDRDVSPRALPPPRRVFPAETIPAPTWGEKVEHFLGEHPVLALTAGLTAGILLGFLVKRR